MKRYCKLLNQYVSNNICGKCLNRFGDSTFLCEFYKYTKQETEMNYNPFEALYPMDLHIKWEKANGSPIKSYKAFVSKELYTDYDKKKVVQLGQTLEHDIDYYVYPPCEVQSTRINEGIFSFCNKETLSRFLPKWGSLLSPLYIVECTIPIGAWVGFGEGYKGCECYVSNKLVLNKIIGGYGKNPGMGASYLVDRNDEEYKENI